MNSEPPHRVLFVGWAGADWSMVHPLLDSGRMPNLERLVNQGVVGKITTVQPHVSPLVWNSIATGVRPSHHNVLGYLRNTANGLMPAGGWHRNAAPFWEVCSAAGLRTHVVNWPTYPAEPITGSFVSEVFTRFGDREDSDYRSLRRAVFPVDVEIELASLRIDPSHLSHEELLPFVPRAAAVEQDRDPALAILASRIADAASAHAMATAVLKGDWQVAAVCYDFLDRLGHSFMRFQPPRSSSVTSRSHELYLNVMDQAYQFCDQMLGRLIELAGPQTTVMLFSDHGFRTASQRPPKASTGRGDDSWLRPRGILAICGPTTHRDRWVWGGSLLDLCPTLYSLLGLPWQDLNGRPLEDAFKDKPTSADTTCDAQSPARPAAIDPPDENEAHVLGRHLIDDGYLQEAHFTSDDAAVMAEDACDFNAAQSCMQFGQITKALELFEQCLNRRPEVPRFAIAAASCHVALGRPEAARQLVEQALKHGVPEWHGALLLGQVLLAEGKLEESLEQFFRSEAQQPHQPGIHVQIGKAYLKLGRTDDARRAFRKELDRNEESAQAHFGLGKIALAEDDFDEALERLLSSAALKEVNPEAHYCLAKTLNALGRPEDARRAVERALRQNPSMAEAAELRATLIAKST